jgi:hypothetical protein
LFALRLQFRSFSISEKKSVIYFIEDGLGRIKIGFTDGDPYVRLQDLQTGSSVPLRLIGSMAGNKDTEKDLHRRFAAWRVLFAGQEWFTPTDELMDLIQPKQVRKCGNTEVAIKSVSIKVLTVGRKQFTAVLLKQLPESEFVSIGNVWTHLSEFPDEPISLEQYRRGDFWGWVVGDSFVTTGDDDIVYENPMKHRSRWVIFEREDILCKWNLPRPLTHDFFPGSEDEKFNKSIHVFFSKLADQLITPENQLFIGV